MKPNARCRSNDIFYTYLYGYGYGSDPTGGRPLIFIEKAHRTTARNMTEEGEIVVGVVSHNPADPNVVLPDEIKGRVIFVWRINPTLDDTAAYGIAGQNRGIATKTENIVGPSRFTKFASG